MGETEDFDDTIIVRRELWGDGHYYSVARNSKGQILSWRRWRGSSSTKRTTQRASEIVYEKKAKVEGQIQFFPTDKEYKEKPKPVSKYKVIIKMVTSNNREWFCVYQSPHKYLTDQDKRYILNVLVPQYKRRSDNSIYDEGIGPGGVQPVLTINLLNPEERVYFA